MFTYQIKTDSYRQSSISFELNILDIGDEVDACIYLQSYQLMAMSALFLSGTTIKFICEFELDT